MSLRAALLSCFGATVLLVLLALGPLPRYIPLLDARVRAASMDAMNDLRHQGYWLINMELMETNIESDRICFTWEYRYRNRLGIAAPETIQTCHEI